MTCDGCKGAITRILTKTEGVKSIDADVAAKKVIVTGTAPESLITEKLQKWSASSGKEVKFVKQL